MKNRTKPSSANASDMAAPMKIAHELTFLGLAGSRDAKTVGGDTDADTRANGRQAVTDDLQCCEYKRDPQLPPFSYPIPLMGHLTNMLSRKGNRL